MDFLNILNVIIIIHLVFEAFIECLRLAFLRLCDVR